MKYKRIKPNQYRGLLYLVVIDMTLCMILIFLRKWIKIKGLITITGLGGLLGIAIALWKRKAIRYAFLFNDFIMRQEIVQYTYDKNKKRIDYYPQMFFKEENGILYFKLRLDGSIISRKFRDLAQPLSDFFKMVLVESYEELVDQIINNWLHFTKRLLVKFHRAYKSNDRLLDLHLLHQNIYKFCLQVPALY